MGGGQENLPVIIVLKFLPCASTWITLLFIPKKCKSKAQEFPIYYIFLFIILK